MIKITKRIDKYLLFILALTISGSAIVGCEYFPESTFNLANESRLPKWITLPPRHTRADVSITMSYYDNLWGNDVKVILYDGKMQILKKVYGKEKDNGPFQLKHPPQGFSPGYPLYEVITVNGITEIIEHRKMEPIFYITDDPDVRNEICAGGCG